MPVGELDYSVALQEKADNRYSMTPWLVGVAADADPERRGSPRIPEARHMAKKWLKNSCVHGDCKSSPSSCWEPVLGLSRTTVPRCWDGDVVEERSKQDHTLIHTHELLDLDRISRIVVVWQTESDTLAHEHNELGRSLLVSAPWSWALDELLVSMMGYRSHHDGRPPQIAVFYALVSWIVQDCCEVTHIIVRGSFLILNFTPWSPNDRERKVDADIPGNSFVEYTSQCQLYHTSRECR